MWLYLNVADLTVGMNGFAMGLVFDLPLGHKIYNRDGRIDGNFVGFDRTKYGCELDREIAGFWLTQCKKKGIRAFTRQKAVE